MFCTRCGSNSHSAYDCSAPDQKLVPPPQGTNLPASASQFVTDGKPLTKASPLNGPQIRASGVSLEENQTCATGLPEVRTSVAGNPLEPPRWPGGPPICERENLPGFESKAAALGFNRALVEIEVAPWQCEACGLWHYRSRHVGFSTDGSKPSPRLPNGWVPFMRANRPRPPRQGELPEQARAAKKELYPDAPPGLSSGAQAEMKL